MKINVNLNDAQELILELAQEHGIGRQQVLDDEEWKLSYKKPLQEKFANRLADLLESVQLFKAARANGDAQTAVCAVVGAKVVASLIADDFSALEQDLLNVLRLDSTDLSEDYIVPSHYGYSQK
jgi:hypothetical protein